MTDPQWVDVLFGSAIALLLTWLVLIAALAPPTRKMLRLEAAYRRFLPSDALLGRDERLRLQLLVVAVLVILSLFLLGILLSRAMGERAVESTSTQSATPGGLSSSAGPSPTSDPRSTPTSTTTPGAGGNTGSGSAAAQTIQVEDLPDSARPFQTVRIHGTYHGGADTFLRVQRWEAGKWLAFPLPTKTDQSGQFTAHVEFGQLGRYQLRMLDPDSGVTSKPFLLVIKD
jgi:hypothetical protein